MPHLPTDSAPMALDDDGDAVVMLDDWRRTLDDLEGAQRALALLSGTLVRGPLPRLPGGGEQLGLARLLEGLAERLQLNIDDLTGFGLSLGFVEVQR